MIVLVLLLISFILRIFAIHLDPFLHSWDERFHALVAKNMMVHPFKPMLNALPAVGYDYTAWCCNHIWLHKQPLFLWQMALSMKIFGVSEWAMRLPSALMGTVMVFFLYRITLLTTYKRSTALIAAALLGFSNYHLELISGYHGMEHNDVAFGFYVLASIWAYSEYLRRNTLQWAMFIGFFAGCAILNKWLTGLLVFSGWGIKVLFDWYHHQNKKQLLHLLAALLICVLIFLPWQIYIYSAFPQEAQHEFTYNTQHIWHAVEGHEGSVKFYFDNFHLYFGQHLWLLIFPGMLLLLYQRSIFNRTLSNSVLFYFTLIFLFFSLLVKTKLPSYFFVIAPLGMLFIALVLNEILQFFIHKNMKILAAYTFIIALFFSLRPFDMWNYRQNNPQMQVRLHNKAIYQNLKKELPADVNIVMNVPEYEHTDVMFYNEGLSAYHWWISEEDMNKLAEKGIKIAAFEDHSPYILPEYVKKYPYLHIIKKQLQQN
ncbi:MAG: glycosyltransferase family 39 protein [Sphingobacteriales bacterium]|nr:glycosyltransferase family 39 protein [Sphingobacteriales bacterium]